MSEGIEILVFSAMDLTTPIDTIARRWEPSLLEEHNRDGGGSFRIRIDDSALVDTPTLLQEGNIAQVKVDGVARVVFEIKKKTIQIVPEGEYEGEWLEVSGPGLLDWFTHARVLPERGISQQVDERAFNFTAATGTWYNAADWTNAVSVGGIHSAPGFDPNHPREWPPGLNVSWIWSTTANPAPTGDIFMRREFTLDNASEFRIVASVNDYAAIYIDGVRVMVMSDNDSFMNTYTESVELEAGNHVIAVQARNASGPAGFAMALCYVADQLATEHIKDSHRVIWTGGNDLNLWKVRAYPAVRPGFTLGQILIKLVDEAKARNVRSLQNLTLNFTATHDSYNIPWGQTYDLTVNVGTNYREILQEIQDSYADIWVTPDFEVNVTAQRGVDRSVSVAGEDPVTFRRGLNVLGADTEVTAEIANAAFVKTNNGMVETAGPADSISKYGRREMYLSAADSAGTALSSALTTQLFNKYSNPRYTPTLRIVSGEGYQPWEDFEVGDWILAPSDLDPQTLVKRRIMSISASETETGLPVYTCEIDSIQESYEERINRWLSSIENNNMSGGISGTKSGGSSVGDLPAPGSGKSSPPVPFVRDLRIPTAPTGVSVVPDIVQSARNTPVGKLSVYWSHDELAIDGTDLIPAGFEVWIRENNPANLYYILGSVTGNVEELYAEGLRIKDLSGNPIQYQVVVRAKAESGKMSDSSQPILVTMVDDLTAPLKPSTPTVTAVKAVYKVVTDGKDLNGSAAAADYEYTIVESSATSGGTYVAHDKIYGAGETMIGGFGYATRWFRVKHVDRSGNVSVPSTAASATTTPLVDADIILSRIDAAETQLVNIGDTSLLTGAVIARHITASEEMWTKVLGAHTIKAIEIDVNNLTADTGFVSNMRTNILTADAVTATVLKADAITSKHTITGALIQSSATPSAGIKFDSSFFKAYASGGAETFSITAATGAVTGTGTWRTGTSGNYASMTGDVNGGILRFYTGSGSGRGSVWARSGPGEQRISMAFSDLDDPTGGALPVVVATPTKAYLNYGSRNIMCWDNAGVEELLLDAEGAAVIVRGNMDFRSGRTQYRYGAATSLAYVGQRPESGVSPDFEIRVLEGGIRLGGPVTNLSAYDNSTTGSANLNIDASGLIRRSSSASRYKLDQKVMEIPDSVFAPRMKDWIDKSDAERAKAFETEPRPLRQSRARELAALNLRRVPGMVAEDLEAANAKQFVIYGPDGQTEGIMYDRYALARTEVLKRQLDKALVRIEALERSQSV